MSYQDIYMTCGDDVLGTTGKTSSRRGKVSRVYADINTLWAEALDLSASINVEDRKDTYYCESKIKFWKEKGNLKKVKEWDKKRKEAEEYNIEAKNKEYVSISISPAWNLKQLELEISTGGHSAVKVTKDDLLLLSMIKLNNPEAIYEIEKRFKTNNLNKIKAAYVAEKV